jgi:hypothetical protein
MINNKYALAVEIEDGLFEIFDMLHFEKGTALDIRYQNATLKEAIGIYAPFYDNINIGDILDVDVYLSKNIEKSDNTDKDQNVYLLLSDNKVFGIIENLKSEAYDEKYQAAFESKVVVVNVSLEKNVGFGDLWDGQKIIKAV